jgi:hypothetical protein
VNPSVDVPINPDVAVIFPVIVADVRVAFSAVKAPREVTRKEFPKRIPSVPI